MVEAFILEASLVTFLDPQTFDCTYQSCRAGHDCVVEANILTLNTCC